jgi:hypothetical protein
LRVPRFPPIGELGRSATTCTQHEGGDSEQIGQRRERREWEWNGGDYPVGKGKPPRQTQWPKGVSGNPGGKKKGTIDLKTAFQNAASREVKFSTKGGEEKNITLLEAIVTCLFQTATKGDIRAINLTLEWVGRVIGSDLERKIETPEEDHEILQRFRDRQKYNGAANRCPTRDTAETADGVDTSPGEDEHA